MPRRSGDLVSRLDRRIRLRDLRILISIAQFGSMAKAASDLAITQSAVSQAVAALEEALGVRLLDRGPKGVILTIYGQSLLARSHEVFDSLKQGMRDIEFLASPGSGDVWIGCHEALLAGVVPAIIRDLARRHPRIVVHTAEANFAVLDFQKLRNREIDLMFGRVAGPLREPDICEEVLFEDSLIIVVGQQHHLASRRRLSLADLMNEGWILGEAPNVVQSLIIEAFRDHGLELPRTSVASTSPHLVFQLLATAGYVTVTPRSLWQFNPQRSSLKVLPIDLGKRHSVAIMTLKNRTLSAAGLAFIESGRSIAKSLLPAA
jgi:DNA-binding transcriptional LysR family regulator